MNFKPIIIVAGVPNSIFFELFFKVIKKNIRSPIILIASKKLITKQAKILKKKIKPGLVKYNKKSIILGCKDGSLKLLSFKIKYNEK